MQAGAKPRVIKTVRGWRAWLLAPFSWLIRTWGASLRIEIGPESRRALSQNQQPIVVVLWHNRLFIAPPLVAQFRRGRPVHALISASKDGAWLSGLFSLCGLNAIRGSSSRGGREALHEMVEAVRKGDDIGITPDGPRGPCYDFKAGALLVARRTRAPVVLLGAVFESAWRLPSWDRFVLPRPFSRVRLHARMASPAELAARDDAANAIGARLRLLNPDDLPAPPAPVV